VASNTLLSIQSTPSANSTPTIWHLNIHIMVKEKVSRIYDEEGFRRRAAAICVRNHMENEVGLSVLPNVCSFCVKPAVLLRGNQSFALRSSYRYCWCRVLEHQKNGLFQEEE
jgi:hypothetical protein